METEPVPDDKQVIRIKPSLIPFTWKGLALLLLGVAVYLVASAYQPQIQSVSPIHIPTSILSDVSLGLIGLGLLAMLVGLVRRNMYTYLLTDSEIVVQKQLLSRSVRRIPFTSLSDVEVSQTLIGRLAGYGNIIPVTKSGYGLVRGVNRTENLVAEMTNTPNPDKVADIILTRASLTPKPNTNQ
jgi:membrane protein YdbS with pleckstrin-like domain